MEIERGPFLFPETPLTCQSLFGGRVARFEHEKIVLAGFSVFGVLDYLDEPDVPYSCIPVVNSKRSGTFYKVWLKEGVESLFSYGLSFMTVGDHSVLYMSEGTFSRFCGEHRVSRVRDGCWSSLYSVYCSAAAYYHLDVIPCLVGSVLERECVSEDVVDLFHSLYDRSPDFRCGLGDLYDELRCLLSFFGFLGSSYDSGCLSSSINSKTKGKAKANTSGHSDSNTGVSLSAESFQGFLRGRTTVSSGESYCFGFLRRPFREFSEYVYGHSHDSCDCISPYLVKVLRCLVCVVLKCLSRSGYSVSGIDSLSLIMNPARASAKGTVNFSKGPDIIDGSGSSSMNGNGGGYGVFFDDMSRLHSVVLKYQSDMGIVERFCGSLTLKCLFESILRQDGDILSLMQSVGVFVTSGVVDGTSSGSSSVSNVSSVLNVRNVSGSSEYPSSKGKSRSGGKDKDRSGTGVTGSGGNGNYNYNSNGNSNGNGLFPSLVVGENFGVLRDCNRDILDQSGDVTGVGGGGGGVRSSLDVRSIQGLCDLLNPILGQVAVPGSVLCESETIVLSHAQYACSSVRGLRDCCIRVDRLCDGISRYCRSIDSDIEVFGESCYDTSQSILSIVSMNEKLSGAIVSLRGRINKDTFQTSFLVISFFFMLIWFLVAFIRSF